ncbi:MAG: hypothetical protein ABI624_20115 [Casimicrobiaceae bacterium]
MKPPTVLLALLLAACATPAPDLNRLAGRAADTYGPQCQAMGPANTQAWGVCIARAYDTAAARHGGSCSAWQLKAPSYQDCIMDASVRGGTVPASGSPGPVCITMDAGGGVNVANCR